MIERSDCHIDRDQSAQARRQRGQACFQIRCIRQDQYICIESLSVCTEKLSEVLGADFFFTFDDQFHIDWKRSSRLEPGAKRSSVQQDSGLVVNHAASVETTVGANGRLEGGALPVFRATGRLHVVMGIDQRGGRVRPRIQPVGDHIGMCAIEPEDLDAPQTDIVQQFRGVNCGAFDLGGVETRRRHAGNSSQLDQLIDGGVEASLDRVEDCCRCRHGRAA